MVFSAVKLFENQKSRKFAQIIRISSAKNHPMNYLGFIFEESAIIILEYVRKEV